MHKLEYIHPCKPDCETRYQQIWTQHISRNGSIKGTTECWKWHTIVIQTKINPVLKDGRDEVVVLYLVEGCRGTVEHEACPCGRSFLTTP